MLHIVDVIGMALFIGIYAYALSTEPLPGGRHGPRPGLGIRLRQPRPGAANLLSSHA